jgi:hypothetical protein
MIKNKKGEAVLRPSVQGLVDKVDIKEDSLLT